MCSASKGIIKIKDFFLEFSDTISKGHYNKEFVVDFPYGNVEVIVTQEDLSPLLYSTGYVVRKLIGYIRCIVKNVNDYLVKRINLLIWILMNNTLFIFND